MNKKAMMPKNTALDRIESHEKLCRIMQKQTHQKISSIETEIKEIKKHMYYAMSALIGGMFTIIIILFEKL
jgi:Fe2+ transport system protein B